jgi:hypothetical protein
MKAATWIDGHWLYVYGGMSEGRAKETTYDDLWKIDLRDRNKWELVFEARPHDWKGDESDEDDDDDDDDEEDEEEDVEDGEDEGESGSDAEEGKGAVAGAGDEKATASRHARGHGQGSNKDATRIRDLRSKLGLEDVSMTPQTGERLGQFFSRTADKWIGDYLAHHMIEGERIEGKQLRRKAFELAKSRYDEIWPTLEELYELEDEQRKQEEEAAKSKRRTGVKSKGR